MQDKKNTSETTELKATCVIPARLESTRLPKKMLANICDKPLIVHTANNISNMKLFDETIVATDSDEILTAINNFGLQGILTSKSHTSGTSRVAEIAKNNNSDIFINVQGDEPFINETALKNLIKCFEDKSIEMATLWFELSEEDKQNPNVVKLVTDINDNAIYFSRSIIPYPRNNIKATYKKHIGVYAYRRSTLLKLIELDSCELDKTESLEQLKALYYGIKIKAIYAETDTVGVDTKEDLEQAEKILRKLGN